MPQQLATSVENSFTKGLITDSTGLNFPENAATDTDNCVYTLVGDVTRRLGINNEVNSTNLTVDRTGAAISTFKWDNAGGDGFTQLVVEQIGNALYFFKSSSATNTSPLSTQILSNHITLSNFQCLGASFRQSVECQYASGNGYLFVYHEDCDPFYCVYSNGIVTGNRITIKTRDFDGISDGLLVNTRPTPALTPTSHLYNLLNQGWTKGNPWSAASDPVVVPGTGSFVFTVAAGITGITLGDNCTSAFSGAFGASYWGGTVTAYVGTSLTVNITSYTGVVQLLPVIWGIVPTNTGYISAWVTSQGNYPSNSDVWWYFKNASNVFDPTVQANVTSSSGNAPKGHYILDAFNQDRTTISGSVGVFTPVITSKRPTTGTWFQGRAWYTGLNDSQQALGTAPFYTWTEKIYFSQVVQTVDDFGHCYQTNDPTSATLFDLLPTDGGVISIQGCGAIYKLFPLQNALLVFAANGVWYVTGSQGIGFSANDYTIIKLSAVKSISSTSFVDVLGLPYFWNEEGIYAVQPAKQGTGLLGSPLHQNPLEVNPITVGVIETLYDAIPIASKKYVRGAYHPIDYVIQWIYRDTVETDVTSRYTFNKILNFNVHNSAFFPYSIATTPSSINSIRYVSSPSTTNTPEPVFKYTCSNGTNISFADEHDTSYLDWGVDNYDSFFITGYKLRGQAIHKFQPQYIQVYSRTSEDYAGYKIQGIWDYANNRNSNRWSSLQSVDIPSNANFNTIFKRHKIRGMGFALQFKITSQDGKPFDIQGWAVVDTVNQGT